jgi:hypothetical protein
MSGELQNQWKYGVPAERATFDVSSEDSTAVGKWIIEDPMARKPNY